ncbi:MAG TPA: hypothetical protein VN654_14610 [Vicinamibacterales bacterium]|nr:hypothetical protein [Vicinamibacterales bacterium]
MIDRLRRWLAGSGDALSLERAVRSVADSQRESALALEARVDALARQVAQQASKDSLETLHAVRSLHRSLRRDYEAKLYKALDATAKGSGPIIAGPWTGEVGFELLYWIPFVRWFHSRWQVDGRRFVIVSRGGAGRWYGIEGARTIDILSLVPPEVFRARTDPVEHKQRALAPFERDLADRVAQSLAPAEPALLHPESMYRLFAPFWRDEEGFGVVDRFTIHRRLPPADAGIIPLPADYVAVRFYFSNALPDTSDNREAIRAIVCALARQTAVVMLNPGVRVDDHDDIDLPAMANVWSLPPAAPEDNLAMQSAVIGRARGFVGTYGGFSYLAPFHGVPSIAFYSQPTFRLQHLQVAQRVFARLGKANLVAVDAAQAPLLHMATHGAVVSR